MLHSSAIAPLPQRAAVMASICAELAPAKDCILGRRLLRDDGEHDAATAMPASPLFIRNAYINALQHTRSSQHSLIAHSKFISLHTQYVYYVLFTQKC